MKNRNDYIEKMKTQLDAMNRMVSDIESRAREAKGDAAETYHAALRDARAQSDQAREKLEALMATGEDSWDAAVAQMEKVRDAFTHSLHYFKSQL